MRIYRFRINQIHLCSSRYIMKQPRRRIYVKRRTDNDENIRFLHILDGCFNFRHSFSKPYDKRSQLSAVAGLVSHLHFIFFRFQFFYVVGIMRISAGTHFRQFAMQMNDVATPGTFVQVINILCHHRHMEVFLQFRQQFMSTVRFHLQQLFPALIIEINHQSRVTLITFRSGHLLHWISIPQTACIAKCTNPTLGTHTRTRQNYQILHYYSSFFFNSHTNVIRIIE